MRFEKKNYVKTALAFTNDAEGFEKFNDWISKIMKNHQKTSVIVGIEPTGHYWFNLGEYLKKSAEQFIIK